MEIWTEQYAISLEKDEEKQQHFMGQIKDKYFSMMDRCLRVHNEEGWSLFCDLLCANENTSVLSRDTDFAIMVLVKQIYEEETHAFVEQTILHHGRSVEEMIGYFRTIKFWLMELEFAHTKESENQFQSFVKEQKVSKICLDNMIKLSSLNQEKMRRMLGI